MGTRDTPLTPELLAQLRKACLAAASPGETSSSSPLTGHCGVVSTMIQGMFKGDIVTGRIDGCRHFWNRLPDGREIDLTSCQFGGDGVTPLKKGRKVRGGPDDSNRMLVRLLAAMFAEQVMKELKEPTR